MPKKQTQVIRCQTCAAEVTADDISSYRYDDDQGTLQVTLLRCGICSQPNLIQEFSPDDERWMFRKSLYPPEPPIRAWLPLALRRTIREAEKCMDCGAFLACAVMCRKALDILCHHYKAGEPKAPLVQKLKILREREIIDETLAAWAVALREDGNLAAHDPDPGISREDAEYMLQFTHAMLNHVFVLKKGFDAYQARRKGRAAKRTK
ncbi:MAG TPA: DUF4145 domain-containing protein [Rhodothermales bacterium]